MLTVNVREAAVELLSNQWSNTNVPYPDIVTVTWPFGTVNVAVVKPVCVLPPAGVAVVK